MSKPMSGCMPNLVAMALGLLLVAPRPSTADDWNAVTRLKPGTTLRIHRETGARLVGPLVRVDASEITVFENGIHEIVARSNVRRIDRDRPLARAAPWIGMLVGAVWAAKDDIGKPDDFNAFGHALWFGVGVGSGLAGGAVIRGATRFVPVYRAHPPE